MNEHYFVSVQHRELYVFYWKATKIAIKSLLCDIQYVYIVDSDM